MSDISNQENLNFSKKQEKRKSQVRVTVTYIAAFFVFGVSTGLIIWFMCQDSEDNTEKALAVFNSTLPVAAGIVYVLVRYPIK